MSFQLTVEEWSETPMVQDAYRAAGLWKGDGTSRQSRHFAILIGDYGISTVLAEQIMSHIEAC
jgi:hypothetical protein